MQLSKIPLLRTANPRHLLYMCGFLVAAISVTVFSMVVYMHVERDIRDHAQFILDLSIKSFHPHIGYFFTVWFLSCFSQDMNTVLIISIGVLTASVLFKFLVSKQVVFQSVRPLPAETNPIWFGNLSILLVFILTFVHSLPVVKRFFLGQFPPNIWFNSTTIFLFPFAILLFWQSFRYLEDKDSRRLVWVLALCLMNIFIKPSFFFCFAAVFPLYCAARYKFGRPFWMASSVVAVSFLLILVQYYLIYVSPSFNSEPSGVTVAPFEVWIHTGARSILISFLASIPFPLAYISAYRKDLFKNAMFNYALSLFLVALMIWILFKETGVREYHCNFIWQLIVCNYLLHLTLVIDFLRRVRNSIHLTRMNIFLFSVLILEFVSGIVYFIYRMGYERHWS